MLFVSALSALALATAAAAQNMTIQVGAEASTQGGIFQFIPPSITKAPNGTVITFEFTGAPGNHSVTQSSFADPCNPLSGGFDSGWVFIPTAGSTVPTFNLTITDDTKPIWFFCKQLAPSPHCKAGMVGSINAPTTGTNTFAAFQKAAEAFSGTPGQSQNGLVGVGASASAGIVGIPSGATAYPVTASGGASGTASGTAPGASATAPSGGASASGGGASPAPTSGAVSNVVSLSSVVLAGLAGAMLL